jgi:hypothetical protein
VTNHHLSHKYQSHILTLSGEHKERAQMTWKHALIKTKLSRSLRTMCVLLEFLICICFYEPQFRYWRNGDDLSCVDVIWVAICKGKYNLKWCLFIKIILVKNTYSLFYVPGITLKNQFIEWTLCSNPVSSILYYPCFIQGGTGRLNCLPSITELASGRAEVWI